MGRLTTHVLDTSTGKPATDLLIELWALGPGSERRLLRTVRTNHDGRVDGALLEGDAYVVGIYELVFAVGSYFWSQGVTLPEPAFLDEIPLRFGVSETSGHLHVPLLVSPYGYATYRGS